jgi:hypothetical protein
MPGRKPDPYCAFKNDRDRLYALVSRDVRIALVFIAAAWIGGPAALQDGAPLLRLLGL